MALPVSSRRSDNTLKVSVVVCCFNSSQRIIPTLRHLQQQKVPPELCFEIIVVDNNSLDGTSEAAAAAWGDFNPGTEFRIIRESRQGLSFARERGLKEAQHEIVVFVDDDNWLASDYLACAADLMIQHPHVALLGGWIDPLFEAEKPGWFDEVEGIFAVGNKGASARVQPPGYTVPGAGMVVRKAALRELATQGFEFTLSDRSGQSLCGGGDIELNLALQLCGWQIYYDPRLRLRHFLPQDRLQWKYAHGLIRGMGEAEVFLMPYRYELTKRLGATDVMIRIKYSWLVQFLARSLQFFLWRIRLGISGQSAMQVGRTAITAQRYAGFVEGLWKHRKRYSGLFRRVEGFSRTS